MANVFPFNLKRVLTLKEARELLPITRRVTEDSQQKVNQLIQKMDRLHEGDTGRKKTIETEINQLVELWQSKIEKLGGEPKGLWLVDFDCGIGYFCWKFPEDELNYFHGYTEGFKSRMKVDEAFDKNYTAPPQISTLRAEHGVSSDSVNN